MNRSLCCAALVCVAAVARADDEADYRKAMHDRAAKIAEGLSLDDADKTAKVTAILEGFYPKLREFDAKHADTLKTLKADNERARAMKNYPASGDVLRQIERIKADRLKLREAFLSELGQVLTAEQIVAVKDGMTYNIVPARIKLLEQTGLTDEQRNEIVAIYSEARDDAMDMGTSDEKHARMKQAMGRIQSKVLTEEQRQKLTAIVDPRKAQKPTTTEAGR